MEDRTCLNCGKPLAVRKKKFCCYACQDEYYCQPHEIVCVTCGKTVTVVSKTNKCNDCRTTYNRVTDGRRVAKYKGPDEDAAASEIRRRYEKQYKNASKGIREYARQDAENRRLGKPHISYGMAMAMKAAKIKEEQDRASKRSKAKK